VGLSGIGEPKLFLSLQEIEGMKLRNKSPYIAICPVGKRKFSANRKEWGLSRFQRLRDLLSDYNFIQIGLAGDPILEGVINHSGLSIRESAAVIKNSLFFIGLEGGLMHLTRAVGKNSVIVYGGCIHPSISGYPENMNIGNRLDCSPCFHSTYRHDDCPTMLCMEDIEPKEVAQKIRMEWLR
jgi:ADP-heptose:LPS heptosyltransferase